MCVMKKKKRSKFNLLILIICIVLLVFVVYKYFNKPSQPAPEPTPVPEAPKPVKTTYVDKIKNSSNVTVEEDWEKLIINYLDRYTKSLMTLESQDIKDLFTNPEGLEANLTQTTIDYIYGIYPELIKNNLVWLGEFDNNKLICMKDANVQDYILRLISYLLLRDEMSQNKL